MENQSCKQDEEVLAEIYRNAQLGLTSIADILPEVEDAKIREELLYQHEEFEKISTKALVLAKDKSIELKEPNVFKKAMMWSSIKMSTISDATASHIAEMMLQGSVMGISALRKSQGEVCDGDEDILALLNEFIDLEEDFEKRWKAFL